MIPSTIELHTLVNSGNVIVSLSNYGARIVSLMVPDSKGRPDDVVLGFGTIQEYIHAYEPYFGAAIGRVCNRIAGGRFKLGEVEHALSCNTPPNHLHGGVHGFHSIVWEVVEVTKSLVTYRHHSPDGADGYPGNVTVMVTYSLSEEDEVVIRYQAETDRDTILNPTHHSYFNLSGAGSGSVSEHRISIHAESYIPVNESLIPTGEIRSVNDSPFDLRIPKPMGLHWNYPDPQLILAGGYDHTFVLRKRKKNGMLELAARVTDPVSGRILEVETTEPGIHFYTANALTGLDIGANGVAYGPRTAFCLETQHYPDSPNQRHFPDITLTPDQPFDSTTVYRFKNL